jgi:DNA end-binding protein Ku
MAVSLINQLSGKFKIEEYKDTYTAELMKLIKAKAKGTPIKAPKLKVVHSDTKDLMQQLKASLGTTRKKAS